MAISILQHFFRFLFLAIFQVFILKEVAFNGLFNPIVFIMFILMLPINLDHWLLSIIGFCAGLCLDMLNDTMGIHAFCCTFIAYLRYFYIRIVLDKEEIERGYSPNIKNTPLIWHIFYLMLFSLIYHFICFMLSAFDFNMLGKILIQTLVSSISAVLLMMLFGFLFSKRTTNV